MGFDAQRRDDELDRIKSDLNALIKDVESHDKLISGLHFAVLGLPEVPGSGLVAKVEAVQESCRSIQHGITGMILTGIAAVLTQVVIHYT